MGWPWSHRQLWSKQFSFWNPCTKLQNYFWHKLPQTGWFERVEMCSTIFLQSGAWTWGSSRSYGKISPYQFQPLGTPGSLTSGNIYLLPLQEPFTMYLLLLSLSRLPSRWPLFSIFTLIISSEVLTLKNLNSSILPSLYLQKTLN